MSEPAHTDDPTPSAGHARNGRYAWYVTAALLTGYTFAFIDRQVLNLLVEPIKQAFALDDTRVSLLLGLAFVIPFAFAAPIGGRIADVGHRRNICVAAVSSWSLFTLGCGLATSYGWLFAARIGVGAAEACLMPAAWSLIADHFTRDRLPRAMSFFLLGPYLGGGLALILGGTVIRTLSHGADAAPDAWRTAFLIAGLIGVIPSLLILTLREPKRSRQAGGSDAPPVRDVARFLWRERRFYGGFYGGISLQTITFYAVPAWMPTYLLRRFEVPLGSVGLHYGAITLLVGCLGVLCGPLLGRRLLARGHADYNLRIAVIACIGLTPFAAALPFVPSYAAALAVCAGLTFFCSLPMPMAAAALQTVTPNRVRGVAASLYMFIVSLVGVALPPTLIALLTDRVFRDPHAVGWSLAIVCTIAATLAAVVLARALPAYREALAKAALTAG